MGELDGKVEIVTGAGRGIGLETARKLSAAGARVVASDLDRDVAEAAAESLPGETAVQPGDLTAPGATEAVVERAIDAWGRLDIVVNNAGYACEGPTPQGVEQFQATLDVHTIIPFRVPRAAGGRPPITRVQQVRRQNS